MLPSAPLPFSCTYDQKIVAKGCRRSQISICWMRIWGRLLSSAFHREELNGEGIKTSLTDGKVGDRQECGCSLNLASPWDSERLTLAANASPQTRSRPFAAQLPELPLCKSSTAKGIIMFGWSFSANKKFSTSYLHIMNSKISYMRL